MRLAGTTLTPFGSRTGKSMYMEANSEFEKALTMSPGNTQALAFLGYSLLLCPVW